MRFLDNPLGALDATVRADPSGVGGHFKSCEALESDIAKHLQEMEAWIKAYRKCVDQGCTSEQLAAISAGYWSDAKEVEDAVRQYWLRCGYKTKFSPV